MLTDALASGAEGTWSKNESVGILMKEVERVLQRPTIDRRKMITE